MDNIWILTEERPKESVVKTILELLQSDFNISLNITNVVIKPIIEESTFKCTYIVEGVNSALFDKVYLKLVSGNSSFIDYLVCKQEHEPEDGDCSNILMAVEETKTSDKESRNTGVSQRATKFIYAKKYCPNAKLYMLYNDELENDEDKKPSDTNIFGTNILLTLGVKIVGKNNLTWFTPFSSIDEVISFKNEMRDPPDGNVPVKITKNDNVIYISGRLSKPKEAGNIGHDPNIGTLSMISGVLRALGWTQRIVITRHGTTQQYVSRNKTNKFLYVCKLLNLEMEGLTITYPDTYREKYWHYEKSSEKVASILLHIMCSNVGIRYIYENHAGCERGYFKNANGDLITLPKKDTHGENLLIPDVILSDNTNRNIYLIEGKKLTTLQVGLAEIEDYDSIEDEYIKVEYPNFNYYRYLSIFGGYCTFLPDRKIMLYLNSDGLIILNRDLPQTFLEFFPRIKKN